MDESPSDDRTEDKRGSPRKAFDYPIQVVSPLPAKGRLVNAGDKGFCVLLDHSFEEGEGLTLTVFEDRLMILGVVRWSLKKGAFHRHGIKFSRDDLKILEIIHTKIENDRAQGARTSQSK